MASKKQQKRRDKSLRHGLGRHAFEYVTVDEEGNEIEAEPDEKPARGTAARGARGKGAAQTRGRREPKAPQPPSLKRLGKRGALFLPVILLLTLSQQKVSIEARIMQAVLFAVVFVAIMWASDHLIYKMWVKRQAKEKAAGRPGSAGKG
jgi:hypothetical protein